MGEDIVRQGNELLEKMGRAFPLSVQQAANPQRIERDYLDSLQLEFRVIDAKPASTATRMYGREFPTPIMTAALSSLSKLFPDGAVNMAKGAAAAGAIVWTGIGDADELRSLIDTGATVIKITKPYADTDLIYKRIEEAEKFGAFAVGMDIDFVFAGKNFPPPAPMAPKTLDQIQSFARGTKLPFILKGILSTSDAEKAFMAGANGIVVSNHGGSIIDYSVAPLRVLPSIVKQMQGRLPIFADGGFCRGLDAFKAMALGANAVSVGKALMAGLAAKGADGVQQVIEEMTAELARAMSVTGCETVKEIDPSVVWMP